MTEIYKDIKDLEGLYKVSNFGNVMSLGNGNSNNSNNSKPKLLKPVKTIDGYLGVCLCKDGKRKNFYVHRLVAEAFIPNPDNLPFINHKDENKTNNSVENLEWCTREYNNNYGSRIDRISKTVLQFTLDGEFIREWSSTHECGRNGFNQGNIVSCCNGKLKSAGGYIWKYKE